MEIRDIPPSFNESFTFALVALQAPNAGLVRRWFEEDEVKHVAFDPSNRKVTLATQQILLDWLPRCLKWLGVLMTRLVLDDKAVITIGYEPARCL